MRRLRILFLGAGSPATVFALAPLAHAARSRGHEVLMSATREMHATVTNVGLPFVSATNRTMRELMMGAVGVLPSDPLERLHFGGRGFGRLAADSYENLLPICRQWGPDLIVGGELSFAAGLLANKLGTPWVRHAWDMGEPTEMDEGAQAEMQSLLEAQTGGTLPEPTMRLRLSPKSVAAPDQQHFADARFVPPAAQGVWQPPSPRAGSSARYFFSAGSRATDPQELDVLTKAAASLVRSGATAMVAAPEVSARRIRESTPGVPSGWLDFGSVLRPGDVLVHSGGGQSCLTAIAAGAGQILIPSMPKLLDHCRRLCAANVAILFEPGDPNDVVDIVTAATSLAGTDGPHRQLEELREEYGRMPSPNEVFQAVEELAGAPT